MNIKKIALRIVLFGILAILAYFAFVLFYPRDRVPSIQLIPDNAVFIIESDRPIENWDEITQSDSWQFLNRNEYFREVTESVQSIDSALNKRKGIFNMLGDRSLWISFHMISEKEMGILYTVDLKKISQIKVFKHSINSLLEQNFTLSRREYEGIEVLELYSRKNGKTLYLSFIKNQLVLSYTPALLEMAIEQYSSPVLSRDSQFLDVRSEVLGADGGVRLFLQYSHLDEFGMKYTDEPSPFIAELVEIFDFSGFAFDFSDPKWIKALGATNLDEENKGFVTVLQKSGTSGLGLAEIAPKRTAAFVRYGFDNFKTFYENYESLADRYPNSYTDVEDGISATEKLLKIDRHKNLYRWIGDEIGVVYLPSEVNPGETQIAVAIKADTIAHAVEELDFVRDQIRKRTPVKFNTVNHNGHYINYLSIKGFFKVFFGKLFDKFDKPYYTIIGDYVVFSNQANTLKDMIDDYEDIETLDTSEYYYSFIENFEQQSSIFAYVNTPLLYQNLYNFADKDTRRRLDENKGFLLSFPQWGFEAIPDQNRLRNTLVIQHVPYEFIKDAEPFVEYERPTEVIVASDGPLTDAVFDVGRINPPDLNASTFRSRYSNGTLKQFVKLKDGQKNGRYLEYYPNGKIRLKGRFRKDKQVGIWRYYDNTGRERRKKRF